MSDDFIDIVKNALVLEADDPDDLDELGVQVADLDDSIITMMKYRDRCPRGSARRADFASSINRLKDWKSKLEKKIERAREAQLKEGVEDDDDLLEEGGVAGHLMHLYDNWDLTFGELKDVLRAASSGELEEVSEKLDGQNLFITWDVSEGHLKAARNKGNIKSGGLDAEGLASKFAGRGSVYDAFVNGFNIISKAIGSLSPKEKVEIFGPSGDVWYSVEIMFVDNPNTIVYDKNNVVFHKAGSAEFDPETGKSTGNDISDKFDKLVARVDAMQDSLADETWNLAKPALMQLQKLESDAPLQQAMSQIGSIMGEYGITDGDSIGVYLKTRVHMELIEPLKLDHKRADALARRVMGEKGSPTAAQIAKNLEPEQKKQVKEVAKQGKEFMKVAIAPIEMAIHDFAVEVLRGLESAFIVDNSKEVSRLRGQVTSAIEAIEGSGSDDAMAVLAAQMKKLKRVENVASAMEGIVFRFKGNTYKFTGAFAPANQLIGLFKYGRGKIPPLKVVATGGDQVVGESLARFFSIDILTEKKMAPARIQPNQHVSWSPAAKKIPYEPTRPGVGPGEARLAYELGGEVQGGNVSYDIVAGDKKWEVKEPDKSKEIRPSTEGMRAIAGMMQEFIKMGQELRDGFSNANPELIDAAFDADDEERLKNVQSFIDNELPMMLDKGEISRGRIFGGSRHKGQTLVDTLATIQALMTKKGGNKEKKSTRRIVYGDTVHKVDTPTFVRVGKVLDVPEDEMDVHPSDVFSSKFTHRAFKDPVGFIDDYIESIKASNVFGQTDGVILVNADGYTVIPNASLDEKLVFSRITQGRPKFKVV